MAEILARQYTDNARRDLKDILERTEARWGAGQMIAYARNIHATILMLSRHPDAGHCHPLLKKGERIFSVGSHLILYRQKGTALIVTRILHQNMSLRKHL